MRKLKIAALQHSFKGNRIATIEHTRKMIEDASAQGSQLILLQELHSREYFCQTEDVGLFDYARDYVDDMEFFAKIARECGVVLVTSLFEKRSSGLYHNTAVVFEKDGSIAGKYRKMHIPDDPGFYEKFYFTPGDLGFEPINTSVGRLGVLICWDQWYPEAARIMALKGAEILIYPTAIGWFDGDDEREKERQRDAWIAVQRGHSVANSLPVVSVNRTGFEKDSSGTLAGIRFWGSSFAFGAQGELLALGSVENDEILSVEIDMDRCEEVRRIWPFLRDRRIDAYADILKRFCD
ncbi:carbon-nitrogen hydrolase [Helicobacter cappadocius]|uniref:Carbon-nitrogen hydrolase n=1 Tax=Helicobacter cappadocius TaxID=3063998 RepID=A0AA90TEZ5_9HELI|nr:MULTISPECIES: carbon-nitrogen hydrolase [unclassified Helicobacter]MDO7253211.1 carbon-nitrogen hydrolase [Helicobacter sp. faydin-H75]MDP2539135.1 carbon-nitrogen hydrolase [Helicobacter sp. faydin-H76]